jgi:hypothetical protein
MQEHPRGEFVLYSDYARLKAEVDRLTLIVGADAIDRENGMCCDASSQVERLTKAGDAIISFLWIENDDDNCNGGITYIAEKAESDWNAAKGVQS